MKEIKYYSVRKYIYAVVLNTYSNPAMGKSNEHSAPHWRARVPGSPGETAPCTVGQKKKRNTPIYFNTNYCGEMKLVPIIMDYCVL